MGGREIRKKRICIVYYVEDILYAKCCKAVMLRHQLSDFLQQSLGYAAPILSDATFGCGTWVSIFKRSQETCFGITGRGYGVSYRFVWGLCSDPG